MSVQEGKAADEMMLIGSGILVKPVVQWDDQIIGSGTDSSTCLLHIYIPHLNSNNSDQEVLKKLNSALLCMKLILDRFGA